MPKLLRVRFSMLTLLLLATIGALGVGLWHIGREVVPLRTELRGLRKELGYFRVDHPRKINVLQCDVVTGTAWKWRIHLPPNKTYQLYVREGVFEQLDESHKEDWLSTIGKSNRGGGGQLMTGRFTLDLSLGEYDDKWFLGYGYQNELNSSFAMQPEENWYSNLLAHDQYGEANCEEVKLFDSNEPVILLYVRKGDIQHEGDQWRVERALGPTDSLVVWLSEQ